MKNLRTNRIALRRCVRAIAFATLCCAFFADPWALCGANVAAASNSSDQKVSGFWIYKETRGGTISIVGTSGAAPDELTIPATIDGKPVTEIRGDAFSKYLRGVVIPEGVTYIHLDSFKKCESLTSFEVSEQNRQYGSVGGALLNKERQKLLRSFADEKGIGFIPETVTEILDSAFEDCRSLTKVVIPANVTRIDSRAFNGCDSLKSIEVSEQNPYYCSEHGTLLKKGSKTLVRPAPLTDGVVVIPDGVGKIDMATLGFASKEVERIVIPASVTAIDPYAFVNFYRLTSIEVSEQNPKYCGLDGFLLSKDRKTLLQAPGGRSDEFVFPEGLTTIAECAFLSCFKATNLKLPEGVTKIENGAFKNCNQLRSVSLPASLTSISGLAFVFGSAKKRPLISVEASPKNSNYCVVNGLLLTKDCRTLIRAVPNSEYDVVVPDGVTTIADYAFSRCGLLRKIVLPASALNFDDKAFYLADNIMSIEVAPENPNFCGVDGSLLSKDRRTLVRCCNYSKGVAVIPEEVTKIGPYAFSGDTRVEIAPISKNVVEIVGNPFVGCAAMCLTAVAEQNPNYCVANYALMSKDGKTLVCFYERTPDFVIPEGVTRIEDYAFFNLDHLYRVKIPEGVTEIGEHAFADCARLSSVSIPSSVKTIGDYAFFGCSFLNEVSFTEGVTSIGNFACACCRDLKRVDVPASVSEIAPSAFFLCTDRMTIYGVPGSYAEQYAHERMIPFVDASAEADEYFDEDLDM